MMKKRLAIAGLGAAAQQIHLPAYAKVSGLEVVGGFDPQPPKGKTPFPLFASVEEMLARTTPDILTVAAPPAQHYPLTRLGLEAGCHVFCEKPFVESLEQADEIVALSRRMNRWVVVNNQYRFMNIHAEAKRRIDTGAFGRLLFLTAEQMFRTSEQTEAGWRGTGTQRTCKEFGIHVLDLCRFFFGEEPVRLLARMPKPEAPAGPDYLNLIELEFSGDRVAHILLNRICRGPHRYLNLRLDGSAGCIETQIGGKAELSIGIGGRRRWPYVRADFALGGQARLYQGDTFEKIASDPLDLFAHATGRLVQCFLDALEKGETPPCHAEDNRRTLALMLAAYESAQNRRPVDFAVDVPARTGTGGSPTTGTRAGVAGWKPSARAGAVG